MSKHEGHVEKGEMWFDFKKHLLHMSRKQLNKVEADLDQVQNAELTLRRVHTEDKVEGGVVPVNQLVVGAPDETARG